MNKIQSCWHTLLKALASLLNWTCPFISTFPRTCLTLLLVYTLLKVILNTHQHDSMVAQINCRKSGVPLYTQIEGTEMLSTSATLLNWTSSCFSTFMNTCLTSLLQTSAQQKGPRLSLSTALSPALTLEVRCVVKSSQQKCIKF